MNRQIPVFPLGTVLAPGALLPLHVFEARYRALMDELTAGDPSRAEFAVVLIERGSEVGGGEVRCEVGTVARLVAHQQLSDGRWAALALGSARCRVVRWLPDDPYPRAEVDIFDPTGDENAGGPEHNDLSLDDLEPAVRAVRRTLALAAELGQDVAPVGFELAGDAHRALWQLCAAVPLGPLDQQRLLEAPTARRRAQILTEEAEGLALVLAMRLGSG